MFAQTAPAQPARRSRRQPAQPPAAPAPPPATPAPPARAAAGAVPGGREGRVHQSAGRVPAVGRRQGRRRARQRADPEEADRERRQGEAAPGQPAEAADQRQRDERGGARRSSRRKSSGSTKDAERFQQDAQAEINELQQEVQNEFVKKLSADHRADRDRKGPAHRVQRGGAGIAWAAPGLDLTADVDQEARRARQAGGDDAEVDVLRAKGLGIGD